jgi:hypothetical protein
MILTTSLEKRTAESIWYDIDCTLLLNASELITSITSVTDDANVLTFSGQTVNTVAITYPDGSVGAIGKVIIVKIGGGVIGAGATSKSYTIRALFNTGTGNTREATVIMNVTNLAFQQH